MADMDQAIRLNTEAITALRDRRGAEARRLSSEAVALAPDYLPAWLNLSAACRLEKDLDGALEAIEQVVKRDPHAFLAQLTKAALIEEKGQYRLAAAAYDAAFLQLPPMDRLTPELRAAVERGRRLQARVFTEMDNFLSAELGGAANQGSSAESRRMNGFVDLLLRKKQRYISQPTSYFYPGLPAIEFFDREDFPWLPELEAATPMIQAELAAVLSDRSADDGFEPYVQIEEGQPMMQWAELNHSPSWSAYHFSFYGVRNKKNCASCPKTVALLETLPQPVTSGRSPAAMFSVLAPQTHIPAHTGVSNTRLLCHLPLVVPPGCSFRVGSSFREWKLGEAFVFDDTIEHEAWNKSDHQRIVMIFDVWHPYLSADERAFITQVMTALDRFNDQPN